MKKIIFILFSIVYPFITAFLGAWLETLTKKPPVFSIFGAVCCMLGLFICEALLS